MKLEFKRLKEKPGSLTFKEKPDFTDVTEFIKLRIRRDIKILVVVDGNRRLRLNFGRGSGFGVGRIIDLFRNERQGCYTYSVDVATRYDDRDGLRINPEPQQNEAKYENFAFDSRNEENYILDGYDVLLLFGIGPDNLGESDENIYDYPWATTNDELEVLQEWMNQGGGVFATGDHDYLGASMCSRIPRVGTMRAWTNADGVPPIDGETRIDTNQPANFAQRSGNQDIPNSVEQDERPQFITPVPFTKRRVGLFTYSAPHEILCHPEYGTINVMPDHPHEGFCIEPGDIKINENVRFGNNQKEYPTHNRIQPKPKILAYGHVIARENHQKGRVNARRFGMISAYDGWGENNSTIGRVVVDSTWHHWLNMNIEGIEENGTVEHWEKIKRYYINVVNWLIPKNRRCILSFILPFFTSEGVREIRPVTPLWEVGINYGASLGKILGPCTKSRFIFDRVRIIDPKLYLLVERYLDVRKLPEIDPLGPYCLSCPPIDVLENYITGSIFRGIEGMVEKLTAAATSAKLAEKFSLNEEKFESLIDEGIKKGIETFRKELFKGIDEIERTLR